MRVWEVLLETQKSHGTPERLTDQVSDALPGVYVQRQLRNTDPYLQYRYGMAVAAARAIQNGDLDSSQYEQESAFAENLTQVVYVPDDVETIKLASQLMGVIPTAIDATSSHESDQVNVNSTVARIKRNKYGI